MNFDIIIKRKFRRNIKLEVKRRGLQQLESYFIWANEKIKKVENIEPKILFRS